MGRRTQSRTKIAPLPFPGVAHAHFERYSDLHGAEHVNRVICLGQLLGARVGRFVQWNPRRAASLWAATFIHDLARTHEDVCHYHGQWAVERKLPTLLPFLLSHGLDPEDLDAVVTAVENHCHNEELSRDHPHWWLTALLKDADGLDRCRLGAGEQTDPSYLRLPGAADLIGIAEEQYIATEVRPGLGLNLPELWHALNAIAE